MRFSLWGNLVEKVSFWGQFLITGKEEFYLNILEL